MPKITLLIKHKLSKDEALNRIEKLLEDIKSQFNDQISDLQEKWNGNEGKFSFKIKSFSVSGKLIVSEFDVQMEAKFPLVAIPFKGKIEAKLRERTEQILS